MHYKVAYRARPMLHYPNYTISHCWLGWRAAESIVRPNPLTCPWTTGPPSVQVGGSGHFATRLRHRRPQLGEQQTVHQATCILSWPSKSRLVRVRYHGRRFMAQQFSAHLIPFQVYPPSDRQPIHRNPQHHLYILQGDYPFLRGVSGTCPSPDATARPRPWSRHGRPPYQEPWITQSN